MSETVDTRVVEARFDSKQFEQGVDKTVKKLDELKKSLNLESTGKSVAEIGNKVEEATNKASNSLEKLQDRFTSFTGMLKQKLLSGIADEIVGVFFKIKSGFESLVTSMSTAQIGVGMQRYTEILTSVRTLVAAGVNQNKAYESIERLGLYADQTSYSLDSMVATMSKFKTAGADIDTAARMIEGLSNAAASMGVNAQQAERAYLNLQQAYSKKVMLQNDWISFESLPMVGTKFNQAIIDAAVKVGTLEADKIDKETGKALSYKTKKKAGTKVRSAKGITADNLGANLASRWFTDEVMEEVFGNTYYFDEIGIEEVNKLKDQEKQIRKSVQDMVDSGELDGSKFEEKVSEELQKYFDETNAEKIDAKKKEIEARKETAALELKEKKITKKEYDELINELNKEFKDFEAKNTLTAFAYEAFRAGQEARSFTDVLNTLKDAISRGWATSFELIFGKLDEAADFFTKLTESKLAEGIYAIGEFRNAVLTSWRNSGGRENMLGVLEYMDEIAGSIWEKLGLIRDSERYFNEHFDQKLYNQILKQDGQKAADEYKESIQKEADASPFEKVADELGQRLAILGRDIRDFFEKVHNWFTEADSTGVSRLQRISNVLSAFGAVANGAFTAAGMGLEFIGKIYNSFKTSFDKLWEVMDKLANKFSSYFDPNKAKEGIDIFQILSDTFDNVLNVVSKLNGPLTTLIGVLGDVAGFFLDIGVGTFLSNIQFFTDVFAALLELIGLGSAQQERGVGVIDGIGKGIQDLGTACKDAFQAVSDFFNGLFNDLRKLLGIGDQVDGEEGGFFKNIENWFNTNKFIQNIKGWIDQAIKDIGSVDFWGRTFKSLFYYKASVANTGTVWVKKPLTAWVLQAVEDIKAWFADLPNKISGIGISIGDFFKSIFYYKTSVANTGTVWVKKDFTRQIEKTFKDMLEAVKKWFKELPSKAKSLGITIGDFFKSIFYYKTSVANTGTVWVKKDFTRQLENVFKDIKDWLVKDFPMFLHSIFAGVSDFVTMVWNALTGNNQTAEADNAAKNAADQTQDALDNSFANVTADGILDHLKTVASNIWNGILTIFTGNSDKSFNDNWLAEKVSGAIENIGKFADTAWNEAKKFVEELPNNISKIFINDGKTEEAPEGVGGAISGFVERVGIWISEIPNTLLNTWKNIEKQTGTLWDTIIGWITGDKSDKGRLTKAQQDTVKAIEQHGGINYAKAAEAAFKQQNWREDNPIFANLEDFFNNLKEYFIDKITHLPENIANGLSNGASLLNQLLETATSWLNDESGVNTDIKEDAAEAVAKDFEQKDAGNAILNALSTFGSTIAELITKTIPGFIVAGFNFVKTHTQTWIDGLIGLFAGGEDQVDVETNSIGKKIEDSIRSIPDKIRSAVAWIKGLFKRPLNKELGETLNSFTPSELLKNRFSNDKPIKLLEQKDVKNIKYNFQTGMYEVTENLQETAENTLDEFNIWDTIKGIGSAIGDAFADIGPDIVDGLNRAFKWIGEGLSWAAGKLSEAVSGGKTLTEIVDENLADPEKNGESSKWAPLWEAVKNVGKTLKHIILEVIPDFIMSAASYIGQHIGEWLSPIFGGGSSKETSDTVVEEIKSEMDEQYNNLMHSGQIEEAKKYKEQKEEELQKEINNINEAKLQNTATNSLGIFGWLIGSASAEEYDDGTTESLDTVQKNVVNRVEQIQKFRSEIDEKTKELEELKKDKATNKERIKEVEEYIKTINSQVSDMEKSTEETYDMSSFNKNGKGMVNRVSKIAELQVELDETTAKLSLAYKQGLSYSEIQDLTKRKDVLSQMIASMSESTGEYYNMNVFDDTSTKKTKNIFENASSIGDYLGVMVEEFSNGFKNISNDQLLKIGLILGGLGLLLYALSKLLDNAMTIDDFGYSAKWIGIGTMMTGLTVLIGYMVALAGMGDDIEVDAETNKSKLQRVKEVLEYFKQFILDILEPLKWIMGFFAAKEIAAMIATFKKDNTKIKIDTQGSWLTEFLNSTLGGGIASFFKAFGSITATTTGVAVSADMLTKTFESSMENIGDGFINISSGVEEATTFLSPAISNLAALGDTIKKAIEALGQIEELITKLNEMFRETTTQEMYGYWDKGGLQTGVIQQVKENTEVEQFTEGIYNKLQYFMNITMIMERLAGSLNKLQDIDDVQTQMGKLLDAVGIASDGSWPFSEFLQTLDKAFGDAFLNMLIPDNADFNGYKLSDLSDYFDFLGSVLSIFATNFSGITQENVSAMSEMLTMINTIAEEVDKTGVSSQSYWSLLFEGNKSLVKFGTQVSAFGTSMRNFFDKINAIKVDDTNTLQSYKEKIGLILTVIEGLRTALIGPEANIVSVQSTMIDFGETFDAIRENFDPFDEFMTMFNSKKYNPEDLNSMSKFFESISYLFTAIGVAGSGLMQTGLQALTDRSIWDQIDTVLSYASASYDSFYKSIVDDKTSEFWKAFGTNFEGEGFNAEFKPTITPVLEITKDFKSKAEEMRKVLGITLGDNDEWISPNVNINITGIEIPQLADINLKLADIETAIGKLENTADKFNDSLSQVSFRIDINGRTLVEAIAPEMDNVLGQEGVVALRGLFGSGTVS